MIDVKHLLDKGPKNGRDVSMQIVSKQQALKQKRKKELFKYSRVWFPVCSSVAVNISQSLHMEERCFDSSERLPPPPWPCAAFSYTRQDTEKLKCYRSDLIMSSRKGYCVV